MILCTCEKPSVAKDIAKVLGANKYQNGYYEGNGYLVTWAVGHLVTLCYPEDYDEDLKKWSFDTLPIIPKQFKTKVMDHVKDQYHIVEKLIQRDDIEYIVNCGDAGREGEYIQRLIYQQAKNHHPVKRLWLSSFTSGEIRKAFQNLLDSSEKDNLYEEAKARAQADWLVGLNLTRLFTLRHGDVIRVGRVQTPTLKLIVDLDNKIDHFKPEPFYEVYADFKEGFQAKWIHEKQSRFTKREDAEKIINKCDGKSGKITKLETKEKSTERPLLYSLDTLQKDANRIYGYGAAEVLDIAQSLYETQKLITYPRTDSNYLSSEMKHLVSGYIDMISTIDQYKTASEQLSEQGLTINSRMINDSKISDHHAIIVTENIKNHDLSKLSVREKNILHLIITRMLCAVAKPFRYNETSLEAVVEDETFVSKTKQIIDLGYQQVEVDLLGKTLPKDMELFHVTNGQSVSIDSMNIADKQTTPLKPFTEGTLIDAMKNLKKYIDSDNLKNAVSDRGLGTVATRAGIIEKLLQMKVVEKVKRGKVPYLHATALGHQIIQLLPDSISSPEMTAEWEAKLSEIESGKIKPEMFMKNIQLYVQKCVSDYGSVDKDNQIASQKKKYPEKEVIGKCPICGAPVYENSKSFYCSDYKNCKFSLWKENNYFKAIGFKLTKAHAKKLLKDQKTLAKNLKSKKGNSYDAWICVEWATPYPKFTMEFD